MTEIKIAGLETVPGPEWAITSTQAERGMIYLRAGHQMTGDPEITVGKDWIIALARETITDVLSLVAKEFGDQIASNTLADVVAHDATWRTGRTWPESE